MKIVCTFAPAVVEEDGAKKILAVFDAFVDGASLVVGITVGRLNGQSLEDVHVSPIGQAVIARLGSYHHFRGAKGPVVVAGVASVGGATKRVRDVLAKAPDGAAVALLCADDKVYDKAFTALNVDLQALHAKTQ